MFTLSAAMDEQNSVTTAIHCSFGGSPQPLGCLQLDTGQTVFLGNKKFFFKKKNDSLNRLSDLGTVGL